jgi:hypothetical protein
MRLFLAAAVLLLLALPAHAAFQQVYHKFDMTVHEDATAHVVEEFQLYMDSNESSLFYDRVIPLNDISAWKNVTSIENMRIHMDTRYAHLDNVRVRAQRRQGCNPWTGTCYGIVRIEYDVSSAYGGSFMSKSQDKPRTYNYTFNPLSLSFGTSEEGDVVLPSVTELSIHLPADSVIQTLNPFPDYFASTSLPVHGQPNLKWAGPAILSRMELGFTREDDLSTEIIGFFRTMQATIVGLLRSTEGLALIVMIVIALASTILLRRYREQQQ